MAARSSFLVLTYTRKQHKCQSKWYCFRMIGVDLLTTHSIRIYATSEHLYFGISDLLCRKSYDIYQWAPALNNLFFTQGFILLTVLWGIIV